MGFLDLFKKKPAAAVETKPAATPVKAEAEKKEEALNTQRLDQIVSYVKEHYCMPFFRIKAEAADELGLTDSKFGGYPYWEKGKGCVCDPNGDPLVLLAQINFGKEKLEHPLLPKTGILLFYIQNDDLYGLNFDEPTNQNTFRVIYHEEVNENVTEADVIATGMTANTQLGEQADYFPMTKQYKLTFEAGMDNLGCCTEDAYDEAIAEAVSEVLGEKIEGNVFDYFSNQEYDYLSEKLCKWGHKLFGYPNFTQYDPRFADPAKAAEGKPTMDQYDTLLFQMDSEGQDIIWGDCGVANFFINHEDLKNLDFSNVLYNWDCY